MKLLKKSKLLIIFLSILSTPLVYSKTLSSYKVKGNFEFDKGCKPPVILKVLDDQKVLLYRVQIFDTNGRFSFYFKPGKYYLSSYSRSPSCWAKRKTINVSKGKNEKAVISLIKNKVIKNNL